MSITLTKNAAKQISNQLQKRGYGVGLRLGVKVSGCAGYSYVVDYADTKHTNDIIFEQFGINVLVQKHDLDKLNGVVLDYAKEGINKAFKFSNPNIKSECGCGESFSI